MNTKILEKLGLSIKSFRISSGFTQEELAEKVCIHPTYVGKIESGKNNISVMLLYKISRALKTTIPELFYFDK